MIEYRKTFLGEPMPLDVLEMAMKIDAYQYNADLQIILPQEALAAPEIPVAPPPEITPPPRQQEIDRITPG